jgi:hypothetical protein
MKPMKASVVLLSLLFSLNLFAQNLIGYSEPEIRKYMKENMKTMSFVNFTYNNTFKYLKYADRKETQTLLFFLTADSVCKSVRLVCDKALREEKVKELNSLYKKSGANSWTETRGGKNYIIELKDEDYTFNITIRLE